MCHMTDKVSPEQDSGHDPHIEYVPQIPTPNEEIHLLKLLREEKVGGMLLVIAALVAIVWANSPFADTYFAIRDFEFGFPSLGAYMSVGNWASDGLLAIFFFMVGLELKQEFVAGTLRRFSTAIVPITAAAGGVIIPALVYAAFMLSHPEYQAGWAIPTATDIAFAVSVLAIVGKNLPGALRIFLLTLAVVDDLMAIGIIAIFYAGELHLWPLVASFALIALYGFIAQRYRTYFALNPGAAWFTLLPIGILAWGFMHLSGIHATIAGVVLAFTIPVRAKKDVPAGARHSLAEQFEFKFGPLSSGFAVPVFAFFSAGVNVGTFNDFLGSFGEPVTYAIIAALVLGKPVGIVGSTWLMTKLGPVRLDPDLKWVDLFGMGTLAGIGFTVSLLVAELSFGTEDTILGFAKVGIFVASFVAAILGSLILAPRNKHYQHLAELEKK